MNFRINLGDFSSIFPVPSSVVDQHIKMCSGVALKVLMVLLRNPQLQYNISELSATIGQNEENTLDGLSYWLQCGILQQEGQISSSIPEKTFVPPPVVENEEQKVSIIRAKSTMERPVMDRGEALAILTQSKELSALAEEIQRLSGRPLTSSDMECLAAMYTYYNMHADFILMIAHYCHSIGKFSMRYLEKTAVSYLDMGIDTHEKLDIHIKKISEINEQENLVRSAFGISGRNLIPIEKKMIQKWFNTFGFDITMIRLAFERTVENTGKLSFAYTDKILSNWHQAGIKNPRGVAEEASARKSATSSATRQEGASYSHDVLDKIINQDYIKE